MSESWLSCMKTMQEPVAIHFEKKGEEQGESRFYIGQSNELFRQVFYNFSSQNSLCIPIEDAYGDSASIFEKAFAQAKSTGKTVRKDFYPVVLFDLKDVRSDDEHSDSSFVDQLNHAQKMVAMGHLTAGVAHDFNNRLSLIMGFAGVLFGKVTKIKDKSLQEEFKSYINRIVNASKQAANLTAQLLAFSRKSDTPLTRLNVHRVINDVMLMLERGLIEKNITVITEFNAENCYVDGDANHLQNMIFNLAVNACDAMEDMDGGKLVISSKNVTSAPSKQYMAPDNCNGFLCLSIRDNGHGISQDNKKKLFEPFFTTKRQGKGTGLGLAAVMTAVKKHYAHIEYESEEGLGTEFFIYFPQNILMEPEESAGGIEPVKNNRAGKGRILLVDDEQDILAMLSDILTTLGYEVNTYNSPGKALKEIESGKFKFDLAVIDIIMPEMNGDKFFYRIKELSPETKVVLASGYSARPLIKKLKEEGLAEFIAKPFEMAEFSNKIAEVLGSVNQV